MATTFLGLGAFVIACLVLYGLVAGLRKPEGDIAPATGHGAHGHH